MLKKEETEKWPTGREEALSLLLPAFRAVWFPRVRVARWGYGLGIWMPGRPDMGWENVSTPAVHDRLAFDPMVWASQKLSR